MSLTDDMYMPSEEELTVQEVNLSGPTLKAGAHHLGGACLYENDEFMLCKHELMDARKCVAEGKAVTSCALNFFRQIKANCAQEFMQYANCLDKSSTNASYKKCRTTQGVFDKCMYDKLGLERPPYDHYARVHVHKTERPLPEKKIPIYPDAVDYLPPDVERPPAKYGSRWTWNW